METCIVRQPILNQNKKVIAYEILYQQDETTLYNQQDSRVANAIQDFFMELDHTKFLGDKDAFLTFTPNLLMKNIPRIFSEEKLVIQIEDSVLIHPLAQKIIYRYKKQGYRLALIGFEFSPRFFGIMDVVDIIKVDFSNPDKSSIPNLINIARSFHKKIAAYNVNTPKALEKAKELELDFVQGESVAALTSSTVKRMDHLQSNFFQLVIAVTRDEPDLDEIARIISLDVTLSYSLIKMVNSAYFALRNQVKSVKQALTILGLGQLKQWIYLLSFSDEEGSLTEELIRTSFLRASLSQSLVETLGAFPISGAEAYLMGMFSTLDTLMEVPLEDALKELPITQEIKDGLVTGAGPCGTLLDLVLCYEKADWSGVKDDAEKLGLPVNLVTQKYLECAEYVDNIWTDLMRPFLDRDSDEPSDRDKLLSKK